MNRTGQHIDAEAMPDAVVKRWANYIVVRDAPGQPLLLRRIRPWRDDDDPVEDAHDELDAEFVAITEGKRL